MHAQSWSWLSQKFLSSKSNNYCLTYHISHAVSSKVYEYGKKLYPMLYVIVQTLTHYLSPHHLVLHRLTFFGWGVRLLLCVWTCRWLFIFIVWWLKNGIIVWASSGASIWRCGGDGGDTTVCWLWGEDGRGSERHMYHISILSMLEYNVCIHEGQMEGELCVQ